MNPALFTADSAWAGGFYELALEIGPRSDDRLRESLAAVWGHPDLDGCFTDRGREPGDQPRVPPDCLEGGSHLLGVARLPNGKRVTCGTCLIREDDDGPDWLDFYLPLGSLSTAYSVGGYPFGSEADWPGPWRHEVEDWLAGIGLRVAQFVSFRLGLIGCEVSGQAYAADVAGQGVPAERFIGYLWLTGGSVGYHRRNAG